MTRFEARNTSSDDLPVPPEPIWEVLTSPELLAEMTPLIDHIDEVEDSYWRWHMANIAGVGVAVSPCFTVRMDFDPTERIDFTHEPVGKERAGADGIYTLEPIEGGTHLAVDMSVHVDLPLPAISRPAVTRVMHATMARMGDRFAQNLCRHLGITR
ncbi:MAG: SRPBCC family protein [Nitriliruptor sp.]|uniref:CoxG family protein n=1 Tax=Nitriliruptor sp. TaxID=2448056 RepID=UPI0034A00BA4